MALVASAGEVSAEARALILEESFEKLPVPLKALSAVTEPLTPESGVGDDPEIPLLPSAEATLAKNWAPNTPLRLYIRSADAICKQANAYERDGNEEKAFEYYYLHAILVMKL